MPNNRFFLETDTAEESLATVYTLAAKYKGVSVEEIQEIVNSNFNTIFKQINR
jgi:TatD DNase family protein